VKNSRENMSRLKNGNAVLKFRHLSSGNITGPTSGRAVTVYISSACIVNILVGQCVVAVASVG
jgi:hypothetical protein